MILPHDINTFDAGGSYILGIPNVKFSNLLQQLRQKKGSNIALITECCYVHASARGARNTRIRSSYDPTEAGFKELMKEQVHTFFADDSPPASPSHPTPWREELINDLAALKLNSSPSTSSNLPSPVKQSIKSEEIENPPVSSKLSEDLLATLPNEGIHPSQGAHTPGDSVESHTLDSSLSHDMEHDNNLDINILDPLRFHGLIIGIDKYQSDIRQDLRGCVGDAKAILKYFADLGVPEDHFQCLYNEDATRDAIISAFVDLINNPKLKLHEPIVIFFAGHGDRMPAPRGWQSPDGLVELIVPHDASGFDTHSHYIHGIPDLTLAFLLYRLSQEKGNNITVILDACHSGSGTRGEGRSRSSHDPDAPSIPINLDSRLRKSLSVDYPSELEEVVTLKQDSGKLLTPSLESHVLLAACGHDELALEIPYIEPGTEEARDGGLFTTLLVKELKKSDLTTTSYTSLIRRLLNSDDLCLAKQSSQIPTQVFQCEGRNQDRLLFSVQNSISKGKIGLIPTRDQSIYRVRIGSAQGIVPGTEFGVFSGSMNPTSPPLATLVAADVGSIVSHLRSQEPNNPQTIPADAYVAIIRYNDHSGGVRIWVDEQIRQDQFWPEILIGLNPLPISWATSRKNHDMELLFSSGDIELRGAHLTPGQFGNSRFLKRTLPLKQLINMLTAVIYFHFHLKNQNKDAPVRSQLRMVLQELNEKDHSWGNIIYEPRGYDLFGDSVSTGAVATLHPEPDKVFGLEIANTSQENLFPYVLYYDFEDYSIGCIYEPPGRSVRAPLQAGRSITVGYGSGGSQPFRVDFTNPKSEKEYGAFVLLVCSEWVDIAYIQQESPFSSASFGNRGVGRGYFKSAIWDSLVVRVTMLEKGL